MKLALLNQTILELCTKVNADSSQKANWQFLEEDELLYEAIVCIFSSQTIFEVAIAAADRIRKKGLINPDALFDSEKDYKERIVGELSKSLEVEFNNKIHTIGIRFKNRLATFLATTMKMVYGNGLTLRAILASAHSSRHAREELIQVVWGFGPKQASLFLRRINFCSELAVLDTHILDYLKIAKGLDPKPGALSRLSVYEEVESVFTSIAQDFGYAIGSVDLATWVTMRVAKREAIL